MSLGGGGPPPAVPPPPPPPFIWFFFFFFLFLEKKKKKKNGWGSPSHSPILRYRLLHNSLSLLGVHMTDNAGPRRYECNPGTKLWRLPVEVTQFWRPFSFLLNKNKNKFISMKPNSNLNHFQQLLFHTFPPPLDQYNLFWSYKKRAPKLGYFDWRAPHSYRRGPAWSVIYTVFRQGIRNRPVDKLKNKVWLILIYKYLYDVEASEPFSEFL